MKLLHVHAPTLKSWLDAGEATVIDVREPAEFASGHIAGALSQPLGNVCCNRLPAAQGKLVVQCKAGRRSQQACAQLLSENPELTLYQLEGGLDAWQAAGFPLQGDGRRVLPLDRQVQLAIGATLLAASIAGYLGVQPLLFLLTGAVGFGLCVAGMTGFCGMARLLARAPWNRA